jgi:hypothetical protein
MYVAKYATLIAIALILAMIGMMLTGWRIGNKFKDGSAKPANTGAIEGAVFALLGLLIAFTFSNGISRFEDRRKLIVEEANDIGTAFLRIDLLPQEAQPQMRNLFRSYLDSRLAAYKYIPDLKAAKTELDRGNQLQQQIWSHAVNHCKEPTPCMMLLLPALNSMIDITTTRTMMSQFHPPMIIFILLIVFSLAAALLAGYGMAGPSRSWIHILGFSLAMATTVYVILDVEYPRIGFIRIDHTDQVLIDLRKSMN